MKVSVLLALCVLFFVLSSPVFAAFSFNIESIEPTSVSSKEQSVVVRLVIVDLPGESYFRVAWQESDGKPYFGYMQNNAGDWVQVQSLSSDCKKYYKISDTSMTSATLVAKIGEDQDILSGNFFIKAHRFTPSCSYSSVVPSAAIAVVLPTPTYTVTPTETPQPTSAPSNTPTNMVTPTKTPTLTPTKTNTPSPTFIEEVDVSESADEEPGEMILGSSVESSDSGKKLRAMASASALIAAGLALLSGVLVWQKRSALRDTLDK